ncbi:MAG: glycosyltransferase family 2 protein, partial [Muribaculaceae bacterium]
MALYNASLIGELTNKPIDRHIGTMPNKELILSNMQSAAAVQASSSVRPKVSVIIAVYGAERWIDRCARSLFEQTLSDIEYIFVDDCSPDRSIDVMQHTLADYPERRHQVHILRHDHNQGVAAARTTGMKAATGEYMIHCDPDDWVEPQTYRLMYDKAIATDADIVTCGCKIYDKNNISYKRYNREGRGMEIIKSGVALHTLWLIMVKSSIVI